MANGVMEVLIRPDAFFSRIFAGEVSLKVPGLIAIAGAIFSALTAYVAAGPTVKLLSGAAGTSASGALGIIGMIGAVFAFIFFILIYWLIMGGVFFGISAAFKGSGAFKRTLQATGYGLIPQVFSGVIELPACRLLHPPGESSGAHLSHRPGRDYQSNNATAE